MEAYAEATVHREQLSLAVHSMQSSLQERYTATVANLLLQQAQSQIRELEDELARMSKLAHEDQLTGILNRRGFESVFEREIARSRRKHAPLCVAVLDLDNFKNINDQYGHAVGDKVLTRFANEISGMLRKTDIFARLGGEEFVIVLPYTLLNPASETITRIQRNLAAVSIAAGSNRIHLTFSAGLALLRDEDAKAIVQRADLAACQAKRNGKNCVVHAIA